MLISIGFFIAASLINTIYTLTTHNSGLFKAGDIIVIIFDIFYAAIILSIYSSGKFDITDRFIFMSLIKYNFYLIKCILGFITES